MSDLLGIDTSHWNGQIDFEKAKNAGVQFVILKVTDFDRNTKKGFVDSEYERSWVNSGKAGILRSAYCWLQPRIDPRLQAEFFIAEWKKYFCELPPVLDVEDENILSASDMLWRVQVWLEFVEKELGITPIVYTSLGYMKKFDSARTGFLAHYPLHLAQYTNWPVPNIPKPWSKWTFWQYSSTASGKQYGASGGYMDVNRFNGTVDDLFEMCHLEPVEIPKPEPVIETGIPFEVIADTLRVRSGPDLSYPVVDMLTKGSVIIARDVKASNEAWVKIGEGRFVALAYQGAQLLKKR